ncbi:hypothetical protein E3N88_05011 [Mikania micrantha]|uniref:Uncharacterized protein n=1 Tax=Mikania micrantha TaxID=192012 RepID=A0A5N6PWY4_9ASTR|nr:hypothetical protein E3N88_05011 [Mikania micrantha]
MNYNRENNEKQIKRSKIGKLDSTEILRGTPGTPEWALAVREGWAGNLNTETRRGTPRRHGDSLDDPRSLEGHLSSPPPSLQPRNHQERPVEPSS